MLMQEEGASNIKIDSKGQGGLKRPNSQHRVTKC